MSAGLRYSYLTSDAERDDYWTPYKLNRYMALLELRRRISRCSYRLQLRAGIGKDEVRPEMRRQYEADLATAIARNFAAVPQEPEEEWTEVYGASLEITYSLNEKFELRGEISHNELPDYDATRLLGGLQYSF